MRRESLEEYDSEGYLKSCSDSEECKSRFLFIMAFPFTGVKQFAGHQPGFSPTGKRQSDRYAVNKAALN